VTAPRRSAALAALVTCVLLAGCAFGPPPPDEGGTPPNLPTPSPSPSAQIGDGDNGATAEVIASHLAAPWGLAFLPDGSALVTERETGTIVRVGPQTGPDGSMTVTPVAVVGGVEPAGDGGLLGIAASPQVATDSTAFVYYSTPSDNRIATVHLALGDVSAPSTGPTTPPSGPATPPSGPTAPSTAPSTPPPTVNPHPILTGIPHATTDNGGWLAFGPDGDLYASTGDAGKPASSRDRKSLAGKLLRMTVAGKPAPGNPIAGSVVYASGLHNLQGFAWDAGDRLYGMDSGRQTDGLLLLTRGADYGWAGATAGGSTPGGPTGAPKPVPPILTVPLAQSDCAGIGSVEFILAAGCPTGQRLWLFQLTSTGSPFGAPIDGLAGTFGRLRTVVGGPDGSLWITTSNTDGHGKPTPADDRIIRVVLADSGAGKT
jgi:glucose/arabinose dehydrogenase